MARNNAMNNNSVRNSNNARNNSARNNRSNNSNSGFSMGGTEWIVVILVLVGLVGVYYYMQQSKHTKEGFSVNTELTPDANEVAVVFFNTDWCGHCQNFKPKWEKLKQEMDGTKINGVNVKFVSVDCDEKAELAKAYNVSGYPTIKCLTNNSVAEFNDERTENKLREFVREQARAVANN
jgi:thiol-disulfide isomerase/thioredoxin